MESMISVSRVHHLPIDLNLGQRSWSGLELLGYVCELLPCLLSNRGQSQPPPLRPMLTWTEALYWFHVCLHGSYKKGNSIHDELYPLYPSFSMTLEV